MNVFQLEVSEECHP